MVTEKVAVVDAAQAVHKAAQEKQQASIKSVKAAEAERKQLQAALGGAVLAVKEYHTTVDQLLHEHALEQFKLEQSQEVLSTIAFLRERTTPEEPTETTEIEAPHAESAPEDPAVADMAVAA